MKKIFYAIFILFISSLAVFADSSAEVDAKFASYVNAANSYVSNLPDYYTKDAKIIRVVNKKTGGQKSIVIPFDRYVKELATNAKLAKAVGYKNAYINRKITKIDQNNYKVSATRVPRNDKTGLPSHFIFTKIDGTWKIKEESMTTNVQAFLNAK